MDMEKVRFPIGELELPDNVTLVDVKEWFSEIEVYVDQLRQVVNHIDEKQLNQRYREGSWTVRQLVHHIADSQMNLFIRLKLALTEDNPKAPEFDQNQWVDLKDSELPIEVSIQLLDGLNQRVVALGNDVNENELDRTVNLVGTGELTVAFLIAKLSWHQRHHLEHIKIALGAPT